MDYVAGNLNVCLKDGTTEDQVKEIVARHGLTLDKYLNLLNIACVSFDEGKEDEVAAALKQEPLVLNAEKNRRVRLVAPVEMGKKRVY